MSALDPGYEIPCDTCGEMRDTPVGPVDIDPPYSFCASERCPVNVRRCASAGTSSQSPSLCSACSFWPVLGGRSYGSCF